MWSTGTQKVKIDGSILSTQPWAHRQIEKRFSKGSENKSKMGSLSLELVLVCKLLTQLEDHDINEIYTGIGLSAKFIEVRSQPYHRRQTNQVSNIPSPICRLAAAT